MWHLIIFQHKGWEIKNPGDQYTGETDVCAGKALCMDVCRELSGSEYTQYNTTLYYMA